jgi:hypothetical protein
MACEHITPKLEIKGVTQIVSDEEMDQIYRILVGDESVTEKDGSITFTANYGNGIEMDVKIVLVRDDDFKGNSYIDSVLYEDGQEVASWADAELLEDDDFVFVHNDITYIFSIMRAATYDDMMGEKTYH